MILLTVLIGSALAGQLEAPEVGVPVFVNLKQGEDFHAICLKVNGDFWQFQYNEPSNRSTTRTLNRNEVFDLEYETQEAVQQRFDKYYSAQGYVKVTTQTGWIKKEEYELARQARDSALAMMDQSEALRADNAQAARLAADNAEGDPQTPGFLKLWGPQIALALGGLALVGIIVKLVIVGSAPATS